MLRNKLISTVALAVIRPASPTGAFAAVGDAGTEVAASTGEEAVFTVADLDFVKADFAYAGSAFSGLRLR